MGSNLNRRDKALSAIKEATNIYRELARAHPEPFMPSLAQSLNVLTSVLRSLGRRTEASAAQAEAEELGRLQN